MTHAAERPRSPQAEEKKMSSKETETEDFGASHCSFSTIIESAEKNTTFLKMRKVKSGDEQFGIGLGCPQQQTLLQKIAERLHLKCGLATGWIFKEDEWDICSAFLHLEGKLVDGLPT